MTTTIGFSDDQQIRFALQNDSERDTLQLEAERCGSGEIKPDGYSSFGEFDHGRTEPKLSSFRHRL